MNIQTIQDVVDSDLCISCGACAGIMPETIQMKEFPQRGMYLPTGLPPQSRLSYDLAQLGICPGRGYPLISMAMQLFPDAPSQSIELGRWRGLWAAHMNDERFLENAASGGIMTGIATHLLRTKRVSGCVATKICYGSNGPRPSTFIARTAEELFDAQGSKYCPVPALAMLPEMMEFDGTLAFIGTPCQIAAIRILQIKHPVWRQKIPYCIGNFCGGFRDLRETDTLIRRSGFDPNRVVCFRYRGGGQPGSMRIEDNSGRIAYLPYPEYARRTGIQKYPRCRTCVDATAELADFSCGDAWIPRFLQSGKSWSILMTRSIDSEIVINELKNCGALNVVSLPEDAIISAQAGNLLSKKTRQASRRRLYNWLGLAAPQYDGGYDETFSHLSIEMKIHISHEVLHMIERLGLYPLVAKLLKR